jgi:hypothetical protein
VPSVFVGLSADQRLLVSDLLARCGITPASAVEQIEVQRTCLHTGAMRRSADVEVLTILLRWWLARPMNDAEAVAEVRFTYDHLRRSHWWPQGPTDLPLGAILACAPLPVNEVIVRIDSLQQSLAEGDEVPDHPEDLVALLWSSQTSATLIERLHDLRTNLLLCGLALQPEDITSVVRLALIDRPCDEIINRYVECLRGLSTKHPGTAGGARLMIADRILLDLLPEPVGRVVTALVVMQAWMEARGHETTSPRQIPGPSLSHHSR